jgi:chromosomal replication initiation ATPase DnaA
MTTSTPVGGSKVTSGPDRYEQLAAVFSRVYEATNDIAIALEVLDAHRAREVIGRPSPDLAARVVAIAAALFHVVPSGRLLRPGRHRDICAARWIASWLLHRRGWSTLKIGRYFGIDHSTVLHGLRRVADSGELLLSARQAETRLGRPEDSSR